MRRAASPKGLRCNGSGRLDPTREEKLMGCVEALSEKVGGSSLLGCGNVGLRGLVGMESDGFTGRAAPASDALHESEISM